MNGHTGEAPGSIDSTVTQIPPGFAFMHSPIFRLEFVKMNVSRFVLGVIALPVVVGSSTAAPQHGEEGTFPTIKPVENITATGLKWVMLLPTESWDDDEHWWRLSGIAPAGEGEIESIVTDWQHGTALPNAGTSMVHDFGNPLARVADEAIMHGAGVRRSTRKRSRTANTISEMMMSDTTSAEDQDSSDGTHIRARPGPARELLPVVEPPNASLLHAQLHDENSDDDGEPANVDGMSSKTRLCLRRRRLVCEFVAANPDRSGLSDQDFAERVQSILAGRRDLPPVSFKSVKNIIIRCLEEVGASTESKAKRRPRFVDEFISTDRGEARLAERIHEKLIPLGLAFKKSKHMARLLINVRKELGIEVPARVRGEMAHRRMQIIEEALSNFPDYGNGKLIAKVSSMLKAEQIPVVPGIYLGRLIASARRARRLDTPPSHSNSST